MDYSRRSEIALSAGVSADLNAAEPEKTVSFVHFTYAGDGNYGNTNPAPEIPMLGRWADGKLHTEPMEFGLKITILAKIDVFKDARRRELRLRLEEPRFYLKISNRDYKTEENN